MQNQGSQFTDSGIWYVLVYRIHVSGRIQGFEGFKHEMGDGGSSRKRCRPLQTELTGERRAYGSSHPLFWSELLICIYGKTPRPKVLDHPETTVRIERTFSGPCPHCPDQ